MSDHFPAIEPQADRPAMPGYGIAEASAGLGLLPWTWALERLQPGRNYWLATTRPDGRPHVMPVWGVWVENKFYFSTGSQSRKARNLAANPHCVISVEAGNGSVIVEGVAAITRAEEVPQEAFALYLSKYEWELDPQMGPVFAMQPHVAFGFSNVPGEYAGSATRWTFAGI